MARRFRTIPGEIYFPIIIGIHLVLWAVDLWLYQGPLTLSEGESATARVLGEVISSWVITVFGFNLLMATRARWVERIFGGLDKMYVIHRRAGVIAMVLLFAHFGTVPRHPDFTIGKPLGFAAMVFIFIGGVLSAGQYFKRKIPYRKWLNFHKLMGPFYLLGIAHAYTVPNLISHLPLIRTYVLLMSLLGVLAWVYTVFFQGRAHPSLSYKVADVQHLGGSMLALEMAPQGKALDFQADSSRSSSSRSSIRGNHTPSPLPAIPPKTSCEWPSSPPVTSPPPYKTKMQAGEVVEVEGPYGHFTQASCSGHRQMWVAGGVGITPFLSMARELKDGGPEVALYWTVPTQEEAHFDVELRDLAEQVPGLTYHLWLSNEKGRLSLAGISEAQNTPDLDVFICGRVAMRDSLTDDLRAQGVPAGNINSEEFIFR